MTNPVHIQIGNNHLMMPIHAHKDYPNIPDMVPFSKLSNDQCFRVHGESLESIKKRGGMSAPELYWNLTQVSAFEIRDKIAAANVINWILDGKQ